MTDAKIPLRPFEIERFGQGRIKTLVSYIVLYTTLIKRERGNAPPDGLGITPKAISAQLITSEKTVSTHRRNIMHELHIKKEVDLVYFTRAFKPV